MQAVLDHFPDLPALTAGLCTVLAGPVRVVGRQPNERASTFPSEVVTVRGPDGSERRLFCKYEAGDSHNSYGHRGGVAYEAAVHRDVLRPLGVFTPFFNGAHVLPETGETWLVLNYLDDAVRVNRAPDPDAMGLAARWLGRFHAAQLARFCGTAPPFLNVYGADYYLGWAERTAAFAGPLHGRFPWLSALCERFTEVVPLLLDPAGTVIHGEFYPQNVLYRRGVIYPVDWESAAVATGEIDLAALIEGNWPEETVCACKQEYRQARWPDGRSPDFARKLMAAQLYLQFRWLGDTPSWTTHERTLARFDGLRSAGERLGLIKGGDGP